MEFRSKTFKRIYLSVELSIIELWRIYNDTIWIDEAIRVKECLFREYVNKNFNLGFGTPKTDLCSTSSQYKAYRNNEMDDTEIGNLILPQRLHKIRTNCFCQLLQEKSENFATFSFNCQKNLPLPKLPDQST